MNDEGKGFLSRWSQRKVQVRRGVVPAAVEPLLPAGPAVAAPVGAEAGLDLRELPAPNAAATAVAVANPAQAPGADPTRPPPPTLEDVQALTPESDFSRFMARDVDPQVKNSAMKKLFADPHYNVMDRLDTYIDDYNTADPIPKAMFKQLVQARMLGLLDDELEDQIPPVPDAAAAATAAVQAPAEVEAKAASGVDADLPDAARSSGLEGPPTEPAATAVAELLVPEGDVAMPSPGPTAGPINPLQAV